jgi:hypothetical protein
MNGAHAEIDGEDARPEPGRAVVVLVPRPQCHGLQDDEQQRHAHRQLRKQIVVGNRESEVQTMKRQGVFHGILFANGTRVRLWPRMAHYRTAADNTGNGAFLEGATNQRLFDSSPFSLFEGYEKCSTVRGSWTPNLNWSSA